MEGDIIPLENIPAISRLITCEFYEQNVMKMTYCFSGKRSFHPEEVASISDFKNGASNFESLHALNAISAGLVDDQLE